MVFFMLSRAKNLHAAPLKDAWLCQCVQNWPSEGVDDFRDVFESFYLHCKELSLRVLRVMALGLNLEAEVFLSAHKHIGSK